MSKFYRTIAFILIFTMLPVIGSYAYGISEKVNINFDTVDSVPSEISITGGLNRKNMTLDSTAFYGDSGKSLKISNRVYTYQNIKFMNAFSGIGLSVGKKLHISTQLRLSADSVADEGIFYLCILNTAGTVIYNSMDTAGIKKVVSKTGWTKVSLDYQIDREDVGGVLICDGNSEIVSSFYIDSLCVDVTDYEISQKLYAADENGNKTNNRLKYLQDGRIVNECEVRNYSDTPLTLVSVLALYEDNRMIGIDSKTATVQKADFDATPAVLSTNLNISALLNGRSLSSGNFKVKTYCMDIDGNCMPYDDKKEYIEINDAAPEIMETENQDEVFAALPSGTVLANDDSWFYGNLSQNGGGKITRSLTSITGMPFDRAMDVTVTGNPKQPVNAGIGFYPTHEMKKNDLILITFYMRTIYSETDENSGRGSLICILNNEPYTTIHTAEYTAGNEWQKFYKYFRCKSDLDSSLCHFALRLGFGNQELQFAGLNVINYGNTSAVTESNMPVTSYSAYEGMEEDAGWRKEAQSRIEQYRKSDFTVSVKDANGNSLKGADVDVKLTNHDFDFGGIVWNAPSGESKYHDNIIKYFNTCVAGNALKWPQWDSYRQAGINVASWADTNGLKFRGHNLVWDSYTHMPSSMVDLGYDEDAVQSAIQEHITDIVGTLRGKVDEWDVVNEPVLNRNYLSNFGNDIAADWFSWARAADPDAKLYINETGVVGYSAPRFQEFLSFLDDMQECNADYDAIGIEGHFAAPCNPADFYAQLQRLSQYGKELKLTEYSLSSDTCIQANFTRDLLTTVFSCPNANGFVTWSVYEGADKSSPNALYFADDYTLKPAGEQYDFLVNKLWTTDDDGITDSSGEFTYNGFYGTYAVKVKYLNKVYDGTVTFDSDGSKEYTVNINL